MKSGTTPRRYEIEEEKTEKEKRKKKLGGGTFGTVFKATDTQTNTIVAIKTIDDVFRYDSFYFAVLRELKALWLLHHPNIIRLLDIIQPEESLNDYKKLSFVFEKMDCDLVAIYESDNIFTETHTAYLLFQLLSGVKHIHDTGIIHRDLKPGNILVNADCTLKICDFNTARMISDPTEKKNEDATQKIPHKRFRRLSTHVMSRFYRAPEVIMGGEQTPAIDVWSIGCIFAELLMMQIKKEERKPLFPGAACPPLSGSKTSPDDQLNLIFDLLGTPDKEILESMCPHKKFRDNMNTFERKKPQDLEARFNYVTDKQAIDLLKKFLVIDPAKRITVEAALKHPFLKKYKFTAAPSGSFSEPDLKSLFQLELDLDSEKAHESYIPEKTIRYLIWEEMKKYRTPSPTASASSTPVSQPQPATQAKTPPKPENENDKNKQNKNVASP